MMQDRRLSAARNPVVRTQLRVVHDKQVQNEVKTLRSSGHAPRVQTTLPFYEKNGSGFATSIAHGNGVTVVKTWRDRSKQVEMTPKGE